MGILGIGADIVHLPRIAALLQRTGPVRLASRILSEEEKTQWAAFRESADSDSQARFLAVRWSVKEAAYKALNETVRPTWKELSYQRDDGRKPKLIYRPFVATDYDKIGRLHVTVSHDGEYVISTVLAEGPSNCVRK